MVTRKKKPMAMARTMMEPSVPPIIQTFLARGSMLSLGSLSILSLSLRSSNMSMPRCGNCGTVYRLFATP
jgi:hypothetical protein